MIFGKDFLGVSAWRGRVPRTFKISERRLSKKPGIGFPCSVIKANDVSKRAIKNSISRSSLQFVGKARIFLFDVVCVCVCVCWCKEMMKSC